MLSHREFSDSVEATDAYRRAEADANDESMEIVLVGADSLETLRQTHGHYFGDPVREFDRFLESV